MSLDLSILIMSGILCLNNQSLHKIRTAQTILNLNGLKKHLRLKIWTLEAKKIQDKQEVFRENLDKGGTHLKEIR
jgi:hypothetical protein